MTKEHKTRPFDLSIYLAEVTVMRKAAIITGMKMESSSTIIPDADSQAAIMVISANHISVCDTH